MFQSRRTFANLLTPVLDALLKLVECIKGCENLHSTDRVKHVGIMSRSSAEATVLVQTRAHKVQDAVAREGIWMSQQVQCSQPPVEAVEAQVLGEPVLELVFTLERVSVTIVWW